MRYYLFVLAATFTTVAPAWTIHTTRPAAPALRAYTVSIAAAYAVGSQVTVGRKPARTQHSSDSVTSPLDGAFYRLEVSVGMLNHSMPSPTPRHILTSLKASSQAIEQKRPSVVETIMEPQE